MSQDPRIFTSESVSEGHPDKVCDQISDGVLDAILEQDPDARVACETLTSRGLVVITGEITTTARVDYAEIARGVIRDVGYQRPGSASTPIPAASSPPSVSNLETLRWV